MFQRFITIAVLTLLIPSFASAQESEYELVEKALVYYMEGGTNNNYYQLANAFHKHATMKYITADGYQETNALEFFSENMTPGPRQDRITRIKSIDISGNSASAHIEIEYPTFSFMDYIHLLKIDEDWKIVSKIFYRQDKGVAVANSSQPTQTTQNQQQNNTSEHGLPSLDDIINGNIPENSSTSPTTPSTNTAIDRTLGRWNFTLNNIQGQIQMYESGGKTYNQVSYQNGQVITEELYQQGDKIYVRDSEQGEYYTPRSNGNLDAYTRDGHVVTSLR
jgi:protease I